VVPALWRLRDAIFSITTIVAMPLLLFRNTVAGTGIWLGNSDRLTNSLKVALSYVESIANGHLNAWNEHEMLGFDSFVLPYTFPNPLTWLDVLFGASGLLHVEAWIAIALLIFAGIATLAFFRQIGTGWFEALVGAACYQLCALSVLKVSQNDMSFTVFVLIPLILTLIHAGRVDRSVIVFVGLVLAFGSMLHFMFLQKAAYALMLTGSYALWRSIVTRRWNPLIVTGAAIAVGIVVASPRLIGIATALTQYSRATPGIDLGNFDAVYEFQNIRPHEILRWLDGTIFGISPSDAARLHNNINLTEGFLLSTSAAVPLLLLASVPKLQGRWDSLLTATAQDTAFWFWAFLFTILVVEWKPLEHLVYLLFFRMDFTHARILIAGLLPMCTLVAIILGRCNPDPRRATQSLGLLAGIAVALTIELAASEVSGTVRLQKSWIFNNPLNAMQLRWDAIIRIVCTFAACSTLGALAYSLRDRQTVLARVAYASLGSLIVSQTFLAADVQVNGPQTQNQPEPFYHGDMSMARPGEFRLPTNQQLDALRTRIGKDRVVLVCGSDEVAGLCAGHIPQTWQVRAVDGYYGLAVPTRIRELPWSEAPSLRTIAFTSSKELPWALLGFLNVGKALIVSNELYRNQEVGGRPVDVARIGIIDQHAPILPRAFLAASAEPVSGAAEASRKIFVGTEPRDTRERSFIEGLPRATTFDADGEVPMMGQGDQLEFDVSATHGQRLLVVNDLYFPGWRAVVDGIEVPILPANVVMRAVALPPDARKVMMIYTPFVRSNWALLLYLLSAVLFGLGLLVAFRAQKSAQKP
jgi:hypothetical protein